MKLRDPSGPIEEIWTRGEATGGHIIRNFDDLQAVAELEGIDPSKLGLHVRNAIEPDALQPWLRRVALISIDFPSFADGRGFSLARVLRRMGFNGRLRAYGPVISDQAADLFACGFDEIETPPTVAARQPDAHWAASGVSQSYQRGFKDRASILEARRQAVS